MELVTRPRQGPPGEWTLVESSAALLPGVAASLWSFAGAVPFPRERHLPNGQVELVVQFGELYARIVRSRRALTLLHERAGSLARVAAEAGYYDQPHMNLDFQALGGLAPGGFLAA